MPIHLEASTILLALKLLHPRLLPNAEKNSAKAMTQLTSSMMTIARKKSRCVLLFNVLRQAEGNLLLVSMDHGSGPADQTIQDAPSMFCKLERPVEHAVIAHSGGAMPRRE
jgi:hypothetical protein